MRVEIYSEKYKADWDNLVSESKNGTFLFYRDFMEYHANRFNEFSLLFFKNELLIAVLPGNLKEQTFYSHQGLTYGGLIMSKNIKSIDVLHIFDSLITNLSHQGVKEIIYKAIPSIYHTSPAQEDLYALFRHNAEIVGRNISSTINLDNPYQFSTQRQRGMQKAKKAGLVINQSVDYRSFWNILSANLAERHNTQPVHSLDEILLLKNRFSENILLYTACTPNNEMVAGVVTFETATVTHLQYIATTEYGRDNGALDMLIGQLIKEKAKEKTFFDFGISTENNGAFLNKGLISQKEGFGAGAVVYDIYRVKLS